MSISGVTHAIFGFVTGASLDMNAVYTTFGALLPDIDHKKSLLGRWLPFHRIFKHRGFTHSIYFLLIIAVLNSDIAFGMATHIGLDYLSSKIKLK